MENTLSVGDIIFIKEEYDVKEKDIISFKESGGVVTHRVIEIFVENEKIFYKTKGDANSTPDTRLISIDDLEGVYLFKIPKIGLIIMLFQTKIGIITLLLIFLVIFIRINKIKRKK